MKMIFSATTSCCMFILMLLLACSPEPPKIPEELATISLPAPLTSPTDVIANSKSGYVYIASYPYHLSIFQKEQFITSLTVGDQESLAVDEERDWVYVVNQYDSTVTIIRGTEVITTLEIAGEGARDIAINPKNGLAYVPTRSRKRNSLDEKSVIEGNLTVISDAQVIGVIGLGKMKASFVEVDPINDYVYVGTGSSIEVEEGYVIVIKDMQEVARYNIGRGVQAMDIDPNSGDLYVVALSADNRDLNQFKNGQLVNSIKVEEQGDSLTKMRVHPITGDVYIINYTREEVIVVRDMEIIARLPVGWQPVKMAIDPLTSNVYVASIGDDTVTAIHATEVLTTMSVGWYPYGIGVNPANGWLYVSNTNESTITVFGFEESEDDK